MSDPTHSHLDPSDVRPMDVDGVAASIVGTIIFAVCTIVLFLTRSSLLPADRGWWLWVALCGTVIGALLIAYTTRRAAAYRAAANNAGKG